MSDAVRVESRRQARGDDCSDEFVGRSLERTGNEQAKLKQPTRSDIVPVIEPSAKPKGEEAEHT